MLTCSAFFALCDRGKDQYSMTDLNLLPIKNPETPNGKSDKYSCHYYALDYFNVCCKMRTTVNLIVHVQYEKTERSVQLAMLILTLKLPGLFRHVTKGRRKKACYTTAADSRLLLIAPLIIRYKYAIATIFLSTVECLICFAQCIFN
ncbi:MAG: hypothetical protein ACI89U_001562 [Gammaproteobacteria bacterium]|jgi:hypothetical protein